MRIRHSALCASAVALVFSGSTIAQSGTGVTWDSFGPDRSSGVFVNITREHLSSQSAYGIAVDRQQRVLVLNEWRETGDTNIDCAVTRHIKQARLLDMDYTGPEELEATRRVAADMGGANIDLCTSIDVDAGNRALISGWGTGGDSGLSGFLVRLNASGAYDTTFSTNGKLALKNIAAFAGVQSRLNHVLAVGNNVLACGWVERGIHRNMLIVRFTASGQLDTSFRGSGHVEIDFGVAGERNDSCTRLAVLPNGDIIAGGIVTGSNGDDAYGLTRLTSAGNFVTSFGNQGRQLIGDGSTLAATPSLSDLAWDAARNRLLVACDLSFSITVPSGCVLAIRGSDGALDSSFDGDGRKAFRYSSFGISAPRELGGTRVRRLLLRDDGSFYVLGTHTNSAADAASWGDSDAVTMRIEANGSVIESGASAYSSDGIAFHTLNEVTQSNVSDQTRSRVAETVVDATWYQGNPLFLADRQRYPSGVFDHDGDGDLTEPGPVVPLVAGITGEHLFAADFDFDGIDVPVSATPAVAMPAGYGHYCSVRSANGVTYGVLPQGSGSDPCQAFLDGNPALIIERSGLYSLSGVNWVMGSCNGGFVTLRVGNGATPFNQTFADSSGQTNCIFTASPGELPIFERPYSGSHADVGNTQAFNHDPYNIPLDVSEFGQPVGQYEACAIDNRGRRRSTGNPNASPSTCEYDNSGVNEPAMDIIVDSSRFAVATAAGRVTMAVPRHVPNYAPAGMDPYQREIFIRHQVGGGRYAEIFTTYYAHTQDTAVRRGDVVSAGTVLGRIGTTGASTGEHLHLGVVRHRNLSYRSGFEFRFSGGQHDRDGSVAAVDPWGWMAPQGADPWVWRFRNHSGNPLLDNAGSWSPRLWISGEAPPLE